METRVCSKCGEEKAIDKYYVYKLSKCKECIKDVSREYKKSHHEEVLEKNRDYRKRTGCCKLYYQKNKERMYEWHKEYWNNHKEKYKEYQKKYREKHIEAIKKRQKEYREAHKDMVYKSAKKWRIKNSESIKIKRIIYDFNNPLLIQKYRYNSRNADSTIARLLEKQTGTNRCIIMENKMLIELKKAQLDIIRLTKKEVI